MKHAAGVHIASGAVGVGIGLFVVTAVHAFAYAPPFRQPNPAPRSSGNLGAEPVHILIPSIGVDAYVEKLGLTTSGNMAAPASYSDAGWYEFGPLPGSPGSAVIAGHVDNGLGFAGVFKHLDALQPGDTITLVAADGLMRAFVVSELRTYPYTAVPDAMLFATSGSPRLVLITCAGSLLYLKRTYDHRLVVFAQPVSPTFSPR